MGRCQGASSKTQSIGAHSRRTLPLDCVDVYSVNNVNEMSTNI